jgi:hypothetical protein
VGAAENRALDGDGLGGCGFEVREKRYHVFGSGFPKSLDVSKAIDKAAGAERRERAFQGQKTGLLTARALERFVA